MQFSWYMNPRCSKLVIFWNTNSHIDVIIFVYSSNQFFFCIYLSQRARNFVPSSSKCISISGLEINFTFFVSNCQKHFINLFYNGFVVKCFGHILCPFQSKRYQLAHPISVEKLSYWTDTIDDTIFNVYRWQFSSNMHPCCSKWCLGAQCHEVDIIVLIHSYCQVFSESHHFQ